MFSQAVHLGKSPRSIAIEKLEKTVFMLNVSSIFSASQPIPTCHRGAKGVCRGAFKEKRKLWTIMLNTLKRPRLEERSRLRRRSIVPHPGFHPAQSRDVQGQRNTKHGTRKVVEWEREEIFGKCM